jgi:DMSO/TMAO reductase YedYZ molybdopterin-dependent catalytic subunit
MYRNRLSVWRSPLRGPWLTSALGFVLLCGLPVVMLTGLLSNAAYDPRLNGNVAIQGRSLSPLDFYLFNWPAHPTWLYALTQGVHVTLSLALIPVVLVKQWSVLPRLFAWPSLRSPAHALERLSLFFLVGGIFFEFVTGLLFIEYWFPFHFNFTASHYWGAWVFFGAFLLHVALKLPRMRSALRTRASLATVLRTDLSATRPEPFEDIPNSLVPAAPAAPTLSRRALLGTVGAGSLLLAVQGIAQDVGGPLRRFAFLLPRGRTGGPAANDFPINGTFVGLGLTPDVIRHWQLTVSGPDGRKLKLTRAQLEALPQHTYSLTLACREGWSTTQSWTGVRLRDLAASVGVTESPTVAATALDGGIGTLAANQVLRDDALLCLYVNGAPLSLDHGYPARIMVPADIAEMCLKWVHTLTYAGTEAA